MKHCVARVQRMAWTVWIQSTLLSTAALLSSVLDSRPLPRKLSIPLSLQEGLAIENQKPRFAVHIAFVNKIGIY